MKILFIFSQTTIATFFYLLTSGQTIATNKKESGIITKPVKLKDKIVYEIFTQTKDTFYFGSDKMMEVKESNAQLLNTLKTNHRSLDILFNGNGTLLMTLTLEIIKQHNDTIPVYAINDPTMITQLYIEKIYTCEIKSLQINSYDKVKSYTYHRRLLSKLLDFKN